MGQLVDRDDPASPQRSGKDQPWWGVAWVAVGIGIVLRVWGLGGQDLTFDEAFTASAARKPVGDLLPFLRNNDTHPPLDYLVREPFAATGSDLLVRLPSVAFSIAALLLLAWWMRSKGTFGAFTTMVAAVMPFLVMHGREARMYSLVMLLGVVAAMCAERWLQRPTLGSALGVSVAGGLAMLSHSATIPAVGAFMLLPGLRRDADAWRFRGLLAGAFVLWAVAWGPAFRDQASVVSSFWIPLTSPSTVESVWGTLLTPRIALVHVAAVVLLLGWVFLGLRGGSTAHVAAVGFLVPFLSIALGGLQYHVLLERSFAFGAWAVAAALGALVERVRLSAGRRGSVLGVVLVAVLLLPPSIDLTLSGREELVEMDVLHDRLRPGDRISISPAWFRPLLQWNFVAKRGFVVVADDAGGRYVIVDPSGPPSHRTHLLDHTQLPHDDAAVSGLEACDVPFEGSSWLLRCVTTP